MAIRENDKYNGFSTNLRFPKQNIQLVKGIDILNGFEQKLNIKQNPNEIEISDVIVRDYPLIIVIR